MPEEKLLKKDMICSAGKELFWKHGISRVSVDEICSKAGVSRMTFYKLFKNRNDLALNVLQSFYDDSLARYDMIINSDVDFPEKVKKMIMFKIESTNDLSQEYLADILSMKYPEITEWYRRVYSEFLEKMIGDLERAQKKGEIRKDLSIDFIMYFFDKMYDMYFDPVLMSHYGSVQEMLLELINFFFYGIMPHGEKAK